MLLTTSSILCICAGTVLSTIRKPSVISFSTYLTNFPTPILLEKSSVSHSFFLSYLFLCIYALQSFVHFQHACTVKSPHLSSRSMLCVVLHSYSSTVKMSHLSAVPCQDVPSFGSILSRCPIFWQKACCVLFHVLKMLHLSAVPCQDVPSFGRKHTVKMTLCA